MVLHIPIAEQAFRCKQHILYNLLRGGGVQVIQVTSVNKLSLCPCDDDKTFNIKPQTGVWMCLAYPDI